jgi:alpha-N-arabinofuranosidase
LTVGVVNPTEQAQELKMDLRGAQLRGSGRLWRIDGTDPMAYNEPGKEPNVVIQEERLADVSDTLTVPPLSISLYRLRVRN